MQRRLLWKLSVSLWRVGFAHILYFLLIDTGIIVQVTTRFVYNSTETLASHGRSLNFQLGIEILNSKLTPTLAFDVFTT